MQLRFEKVRYGDSRRKKYLKFSCGESGSKSILKEKTNLLVMEEEKVLVWKTEILFSCSSTYYICWINKRSLLPLVKEKNYLEIQKYFPKCFDKRKNKAEITDSQENYEEQNVSYQIIGNSESYIQKKLYGFKYFSYKRRKMKKKISVHIQ